MLRGKEESWETFQNLKRYGAILSHLTLSIPETMPKSSGGKESSDSSTSKAALNTTKKGMKRESWAWHAAHGGLHQRDDSSILTIQQPEELIFET